MKYYEHIYDSNRIFTIVNNDVVVIDLGDRRIVKGINVSEWKYYSSEIDKQVFRRRLEESFCHRPDALKIALRHFNLNVSLKSRLIDAF